MTHTPQAASSSSSSSSTSSSSSSVRQKFTYHVFLSFRGEDTRFGFTDHLYNALRQKGIKTFIDDKLSRGGEISAALLKAIEESMVSIIVFSENYASSRWCLDELVKILQCKESNQQMVWPIFYKVAPSDVRNQRSSFGEAFAKLECNFKDSMDKWRAALSEAANLSGWPFLDGYESQFINKIIDELSIHVLNPSYNLDVAMHSVGIESCVRDMDKLLDLGENTVRMIGIWGPGGIGKTTIAKALYNSISHKFEGRYFLTNVQKKSKTQGLDQLQETLLSNILAEENLKVDNADIGVEMIKKRLSHKKVLLILDDVNELDQLNNLARGSDWFGSGSRIIITTRDKHVLTSHQVRLVYEVKLLDYDGALELFSWNAFKSCGPPDEYMELARRAIHTVQGLPLALIVLGRHLTGRSTCQWKAALDSYKKVPNKRIQEILRISFDALEDPVKDVFLDIACFFKGDDVDYVTKILEACDLNPIINIKLLIEKALITIDNHQILMHDLIEEMGKEIVRQESPNELGKRSRLWIHDDVDHVLTNNVGTNIIKGIQVWPTDDICLNAKSFVEMKTLRYFKSYNVHFVGDHVEYLPSELMYLDWHGCPLHSFPANFHPKKLVVLNIPYSCITRLSEGFKNLPTLNTMDLSNCESLKEIPDFSSIPNLKELNLDGCKSLVKVHTSVGFLDKLVTLSLDGCSNLAIFPGRISLKSLKSISLQNCKRLEKFSEIVGKMDHLWYMDLRGTAIKELHPSIEYLVNLEELYLFNCEDLTTLPCSIFELQNLGILHLSECTKLVTFPNKLKSQVWSSAKPLIPLLLPTKTKNSHDNSGSLVLPNLREIQMGGCNLSDGDFLGTLDCSKTLTKLDLSGNNFISLPTCISKLVNLRKLDLHCCKRLQEIPELPPNLVELDMSDCVSLERFSKLSRVLELTESQGIAFINLWNCHLLCGNLGYNMANMESVLLAQLSFENFPFSVILPGREVPKWFCCCKDTEEGKLLIRDSSVDNPYGRSYTDEISVEILETLKCTNTGLAVCAVFEVAQTKIDFGALIFINEVDISHHCSFVFTSPREVTSKSSSSAHVWLQYIPLPVEIQCWLPPYTCRVRFYSQSASFKLNSCGVHLVCDAFSKTYLDHQLEQEQRLLLLLESVKNMGATVVMAAAMQDYQEEQQEGNSLSSEHIKEQAAVMDDDSPILEQEEMPLLAGEYPPRKRRRGVMMLLEDHQERQGLVNPFRKRHRVDEEQPLMVSEPTDQHIPLSTLSYARSTPIPEYKDNIVTLKSFHDLLRNCG